MVVGWNSSSRIVGIGGGVIIVPVLLFIFGFSRHQAQGTTPALLVPPIGILAAWTYYRQGFVDFQAAIFIGIGFLAGSSLGARVACNISNIVLEKIFGIALLLISMKMIFAK